MLAAIGAAAGALVLSLRELSDFDLPGHLAVGRLVVAHRTLLRIDELSFTARPVQHVEYVSDVFLFGVMRWFGPLGLQVLGALLAVAIASLLCKARPGKPYLAMAVSALAIATIHPWLLVRPATVSFALIAVVLPSSTRRASVHEGPASSGWYLSFAYGRTSTASC